jgi:nondiscriminating aspartyl-tRNA synthetase
MKRTLAANTPKKISRQVRLAGWVFSRRDHGQVVFIDLKDRSGLVQVVISRSGKTAAVSSDKLRISSAIEVIGTVSRRPKKLINSKIPTGKIEVKAEKVRLLASSQKLPFDIGPSHLNLKLPKLLDHRSLSLRHPSQQAIFQVQAEIARSFRGFLRKNDFTEIFCPTITATATEGGAEIFKVDYYDYDAYLAQSPQLYKQIMVGVFERVFTVAHAYRAEPSVTTRHLSEYIGLDAEMGFIDSWQDLIDLADSLIKTIIKDVFSLKQSSLGLAEQPKLAKKTPQLKLREVQKILGVSRKEPDLSPQNEREICRWASEEKGSDMVIVTHYPVEKRPFYTYPDPRDPGYTLSFDFIGRGRVKEEKTEGFEWVTGGRRINDYQQLLSNIKKWGYDPQGFEVYLQAFRYGMPPEGGFCLGLERLTQSLLGLSNVRQASLFPRDMERADLRLATIQSKKE